MMKFLFLFATLFFDASMSNAFEERCGQVVWRKHSAIVCGYVLDETDTSVTFELKSLYRAPGFGLAEKRICNALTGGGKVGAVYEKLDYLMHRVTGDGQSVGYAGPMKAITELTCSKP